MTAQPLKHIIKAFAIHEEQFYPMSARREAAKNALMHLGRAEADKAADPGLNEWHKSALDLLSTHTADTPHKVVTGTTDGNGGELIGEPWYAVFEYARTGDPGNPVPGDLWVGRFFDKPAGLKLTEKTGVYVFDDNLIATESGDQVILSALRADRSVILGGRSAAGGDTLGSNRGDETSVRNLW